MVYLGYMNARGWMLELLLVVGGSYLIELACLYSPRLWQRRQAIYSVLLVMCAGSSYIFIVSAEPLLLVSGLVSIFRLIHMSRIVYARNPPAYLMSAGRKSAWTFFSIQVLLLGMWLLWVRLHTDIYPLIAGLAGIQVVNSLVLIYSLLRNLRKTKYESPPTHLADKELPTVSVCVPARNETTELVGCIESLLSSTYPKLEILVLDDCSTDRTPDIIESFAHAGVRFIHGEPPSDGWVAKNHAYDQLRSEASGEVLLFCGADVRFQPHTLRQLMEYKRYRNAAMISTLALRTETAPYRLVVEPLRYWWELVPFRPLIRRPPVLSTCWCIDARTLKLLGGFRAVRQSIMPEAYFAKALARQRKYRFVRSTLLLGVSSVKSPEEQLKTAMRMRYPQIKRRPELAMLLLFSELLFLCVPIGIAVYGLVNAHAWMTWASIVTYTLLNMLHISIQVVTSRSSVFASLFTLPLGVVTELVLGMSSMIRYEFGTVEWKSRNVCLPLTYPLVTRPSEIVVKRHGA